MLSPQPEFKPKARSQVQTVQVEREHERHRRFEFLEANKRVQEECLTYEEAWGARPKVLSLARTYSQEVKDQGIVLRRISDNKLVVLSYRTRFSDEYYDEAVKRIRSLRFDKMLFLTLTVDPKRFACLDQAYRAIRKAQNKLLQAMRKVRDKELTRGPFKGKVVVSGWGGEYISSVEFQKSGSPHLHMGLMGCDFVDANWARSLWDERYGMGTFIRCERVTNNRKKVVNYIVKYITKRGATQEQSGDRFTHTSLLWAVNAKALTTSGSIFNQGHDQLIPKSEPGGWEYLGSFPWEACKEWTCYLDVVKWKCG